MKHPLLLAMLVGGGGAIGSIVRYSITLLLQRWNIHWPFGTMLSNILGCLIIGGIAATGDRIAFMTPELRLACATGFCGGFTTMSSMILECTGMMRADAHAMSLLYIISTFIFCIAAFFAGQMVVRSLVQT